MAVQIKICGLSTSETVRAAIDAGATHIGLNFYAPSPRSVTPDQAAELANVAGEAVVKVGVFVNPDDALLASTISAGRIDAVQLHGKEAPDRVQDVRKRFGLPVWKVLSVETTEDIGKSADYAEVADFLLFDTKTPGGALPGGMGMGFDWNLLEANRTSLPWGLAGGLTASNVASAIRKTSTDLVDTSSGVESAPGVKQVDLIRAFCKAALEA